MENVQKSSFSFQDFHITEFNIKRNPNEEGQPLFDFDPKGWVDKEKGTFMIDIFFTVKDSNDSYTIEASCMAFFKFDKIDSVAHIDNFFYINAPAIAFPYIRSFIASVTALSGLSAIHLPLLNFPKLIGEKLKENTHSINDETEAKSTN